jgi:hypothetical protein
MLLLLPLLLLACVLQVADYVTDPLVYRGPTAVSTAFQMGEAIFALRDVRHQLELPLYALHCTADHITPYKVGWLAAQLILLLQMLHLAISGDPLSANKRLIEQRT